MKTLSSSFILLGKEEAFMKKFLIVIFSIIFTTPVFASCSLDIDKPCTASVSDRVYSSVQNKYIPSPLEDLRKTDAFQPRYVVPYQEMLINTDPVPTSDYNSNCQFGVCLPERVQSNTITE